ncbi:MAG: c-type cytochrome biogenesis protein CcmI [Alphaproteobacteria bacterium]
MSIGLYLACGGLLLLVLLLVLRPLLKPSQAAAAAGAHDIEVYRDQLAELERDRARGLIGTQEAAAARLEIERRLLAAAKRTDAAGARPAAPAHGALLALAIGLPLLSGALYLMLGQPRLPAQPFAARQADRALAEKDGDTAKVIAELEQRIARNPKDLDAWTGLGRTLFLAQRHAEAAIAYGKALDLAPDNRDIAASYAETLSFANGGTVTDQAKKLFAAVLAAQPADPRARFYLGLAQQQGGDPKGALDMWLALEADSLPNAPWMPMLRQRIEAAAKSANVDLAEARKKLSPPADKPPTTPGPSQDDIDAAQKMSPADRAAMIKGMVERLETRLKEQPDDVEGWRRLGRSYRVLGEKQKAIAAFAKAAEKAPKNVDVLVDWATSILDAQLQQNAKLPPAFLKVINDLSAVDPAHPVALFYLGQAADEAGNGAEAVRLWKQLLTRMPADAPIRPMLEKRIAEIESKKK